MQEEKNYLRNATFWERCNYTLKGFAYAAAGGLLLGYALIHILG
jgi:hypothetical protein